MKKTLAMLGALGLASAAGAATIVTQPGVSYQTPALSTFTVTGGDMDGMLTWAKFSDGTVKQAPWADDGGTVATDDGLAESAGWYRIRQAGNTFSSLTWTISNLRSPTDALSIVAFGFFGPSGDTVFDLTFGGTDGTTGSEAGKDFDIPGYTATATYKDIVNLTGFPPVGDLYATLDIDLSPNSPLRAGQSAEFSQDTDTAKTKGTIIRVPDAGSTAMLMGLGLAALFTLRRRLA